VLAITTAYRLTLVLLPPLPPEVAGPAWAVFVARWFEWTLGATVAEWAAGRLARSTWREGSGGPPAAGRIARSPLRIERYNVLII